MVAAIEVNSTHPMAKAIVAESNGRHSEIQIKSVEEISGHGLKGEFNKDIILAGNTKLLKKFNVEYPSEIDAIVDSIVVVAIGNNYVGYITISDEIKEDAPRAIQDLKSRSIETIMLSGDKQAVHEVAVIVGEHVRLREFQPQGTISEKEIVYYADKRVNHSSVVTLADRLHYILDRYGGKSIEICRRIRANFLQCKMVEEKLFARLDYFPTDIAAILDGPRPLTSHPPNGYNHGGRY